MPGDRRCRLPLIDTELAQVVASCPGPYRIELRGDHPKTTQLATRYLSSPTRCRWSRESPIPWSVQPRSKWPDARATASWSCDEGPDPGHGGHEFDRLDGNEAIVEYVISLTRISLRREICLLLTASGDPKTRSPVSPVLGGRGCEVSDISLPFRSVRIRLMFPRT